jgi:hypothetical protein
VARASDVPRRTRRRVSGRAILIAVGVLILLVVVFGRALARFYIDYLWHEGLGREDVFWGVIRAKATLFFVFFGTFAALVGVNLFIADKLAPTRFPANVHPFVERFHELFGHRLRFLRYAVAGVLALLVALPTTSQWQSWLLFRNRRSFGVSDGQFGADVGFYVFELPFIGFVLDWLFIAMVLVLLLTLLAHVLNGGVVFAAPMPSVRPATKGHIAVLLAVLAALKAADYWVNRYELTNERRGFVQGASYAVVNAQLPALMLLMLIALLTGGLFLATLRGMSWRLPLIASGLWLVVLVAGGLVYPAVVQSLVVNPNQQSREAPFITRNVIATRDAMGIRLDQIEEREVSFATLTAEKVEEDLEPLRDVRLLNPGEMLSRFRIDQGQEAGLTIDDLDVDRYDVDGEGERVQVLIAARELDVDGSPNRSWQGRHLINTHGCGLIMAPVGRVQDNDIPDYQAVALDRPELYFSPSLGGYAVARTTETERSCVDDEQPYSGTAGVPMSSFVRRAAFALAFLDYNVLGSGAITDDSQMLWVRNVRDRLTKLAPFLSYDGDPYPVVVDGRVKWVVDAYTSTSRYPYSQRIGDIQRTRNSGLSGDANYVRNSVKAVVDAYDGGVEFYVVDPEDPIVRAWEGAFSDLFTPAELMPAELREHLRYPEDLFRVQTEVYSKYQLPPEAFFSRRGAWSVAQAPTIDPRQSTAAVESPTTIADEQPPSELARESSTSRFVPYYTLFRNEGSGEEEFVILRPFVPFSSNDERTELQAYMTASSDPDSYGELTAYVVTNSPLPDGPRTVSNRIDNEPTISQQVTLQTGGGNTVHYGDLQLVPVSDGLIWVRPFYALVPQGTDSRATVAEYRFVIASYGGRAALGESLGIALERLFPGFEGELGDRVGAPDEPEEPDTGGTPPPEEDTGTDATATELLADASQLLAEADTALREGDLGEYQSKVDEAGGLIDQALELLQTADG